MIYYFPSDGRYVIESVQHKDRWLHVTTAYKDKDRLCLVLGNEVIYILRDDLMEVLAGLE